ncbi:MULTISPECIES: hypothetical protein [Legionella]|uniref:Uncharacterized protein n=1 Tax=Legionella maceachernii TaxID=466 RepID=A0A0W0VXF9_9GAMM|nr:hypothetical protein [Legionella maceachernii]KTD24590.1 hypothetical protein Lmac_2677 [Legionella maceachernii]SJZ63449.1 hypothetical protein SAMN02745128_00668 [Legionella maceachernii]SUP01048.1 Uncharacterised protein [Legionella maceachernii]
MSIKKMALPVILITVFILPTYAKQIFPAEVMGRDLQIPGLGWAGHVGIATTYMMSPESMKNNADQVIEVLNETPVGQINYIGNFKSRSKYWGSKYGVTDRGILGYKILVEANHQRWWCPTYTSDTDYHIGSGIPTTGQIISCGRWRCDTYVWWAFYSQGIDTMPGKVWLPRNLFDFFPYFNDERLRAYSRTLSNSAVDRTLEAVSPDELNVMPYEEFQMIMNAPPTHYVTSPSAVQMQLAANPELNDIKRGIMIDRLVSRSTEPDLVKKLLSIYYETDRVEVKSKIVENLMLYNQQHITEKSYVVNEQPLLKNFFEQLLENQSLTPHMMDTGIRGFIDTHSADEITSNLDKIDEKLAHINHYSSIMLKYALTFKSKELQKIYMESLINELRIADSSDLDSYLFGPLTIAYQSIGKDFLQPESKQVVIDYLKQIRYKYSPQGIKDNTNDTHRKITAHYYFELIKILDIKI